MYYYTKQDSVKKSFLADSIDGSAMYYYDKTSDITYGL